MYGIFLRTTINAMGLAAAAVMLPRVAIAGIGTLLLAALAMGFVNAVLRPLVVLVTLPITIVTLGLFLFVINAAMFGLVAALLEGFVVDGFLAAVLGSLILSAVSGLSTLCIGPDGRYEILVVERRGR